MGGGFSRGGGGGGGGGYGRGLYTNYTSLNNKETVIWGNFVYKTAYIPKIVCQYDVCPLGTKPSKFSSASDLLYMS